VLSLGDICAANDDGGDNAVLTQVNRRQSKKSKKTAALSTVQTRQSVSASEAVTQSEKSSRAIAGSVESAVYGDDPVVAQLQKTVGQLTTTVHVQQATIDSLTRKLNFVLSFLDIQDDVDTQRRDEVTVSQTSSSFHSTASHTEHSTQQTGSTPNRVIPVLQQQVLVIDAMQQVNRSTFAKPWLSPCVWIVVIKSVAPSRLL